MDDLSKAPVLNFDEALAGTAGRRAWFPSGEGQPGSQMNIVIRGANSLTQSNAPLYVIDGFPMEDPENASINPDDIASIDVLKDASRNRHLRRARGQRRDRDHHQKRQARQAGSDLQR